MTTCNIHYPAIYLAFYSWPEIILCMSISCYKLQATNTGTFFVPHLYNSYNSSYTKASWWSWRKHIFFSRSGRVTQCKHYCVAYSALNHETTFTLLCPTASKGQTLCKIYHLNGFYQNGKIHILLIILGQLLEITRFHIELRKKKRTKAKTF